MGDHSADQIIILIGAGLGLHSAANGILRLHCRRRQSTCWNCWHEEEPAPQRFHEWYVLARVPQGHVWGCAYTAHDGEAWHVGSSSCQGWIPCGLRFQECLVGIKCHLRVWWVVNVCIEMLLDSTDLHSLHGGVSLTWMTCNVIDFWGQDQPGLEPMDWGIWSVQTMEEVIHRFRPKGIILATASCPSILKPILEAQIPCLAMCPLA